MKISDIRNLPDDDIASEIQKTQAKIFKMKFQAKGASVESPGAYKGLKKEIARMLTILRERKKS